MLILLLHHLEHYIFWLPGTQRLGTDLLLIINNLPSWFFCYNGHENVRLLSQATESKDVAIYIKEDTKITASNQHQHFIFLQKHVKNNKNKENAQNDCVCWHRKGALTYEIVTLPCLNRATERRENRVERLRPQSERSFAVRPPHSTGQVFDTEYIFKRCIHLKCLDDNSIEQ